MMPTKTTADVRHPTLTARLSATLRDPRHYCALVLAVNAGLVACAAGEPGTPTLLLHLALLPINGWRLRQALRPSGWLHRLAAASCGPRCKSPHRRATWHSMPEPSSRRSG
jgi:hypothetical protein